MAQFKYTGGKDHDQFFEGLPAMDLESDQLTPEQQRLLDQAVQAGIYEGDLESIVVASAPASPPVDASVPDAAPGAALSGEIGTDDSSGPEIKAKKTKGTP